MKTVIFVERLRALIGNSVESDAGVSSEAAVNRQNDAGDCGSSRVIRQEEHAAEQLLGIHEAAHRGAGENLRAARGRGAVRVEEQSAVLVGNQETRSNRVAADAGARKVGRQPLGEVADGSLRAGVRRNLGQRDVSVHGGDVQDVTALAGDHVLSERLSRQQRALEVELEDEVNAALIQIEEGLLTFLGFVLILVVGGCARVVYAGTVDQNIAGAEVGENLLMDGFKSLRIKDVRLVALADIALGGQLDRKSVV